MEGELWVQIWVEENYDLYIVLFIPMEKSYSGNP